jgi:hypothetical protein
MLYNNTIIRTMRCIAVFTQLLLLLIVVKIVLYNIKSNLIYLYYIGLMTF